MAKALVGIVMGSDSDLDVMKKATDILDEFSIPWEIVVASAHRTPYEALNYSETAKERGLEVIIAGAGAAAHLPGVLAAVTSLPVIGVPIDATSLKGLDALYAIVQMPSGVPVATMSINGSKNAALFAVQILARIYPELDEKFVSYKENMKSEVSQKNKNVQDKLNR